MNPFPRICTMISNTLMHEGLPEAAYGYPLGTQIKHVDLQPSRSGGQYGLKTGRAESARGA